ncbi:hypothetical protein ACEWPL_000345 [Roseovarius sp. S1116L3]|uniref:hypothetical protein n=1 Tax=Roseovarius roseus TaxID=3342636 RepID=UPI00372B1EAA
MTRHFPLIAWMVVDLDQDANAANAANPQKGSAPVGILVLQTDEETAIFHAPKSLAAAQSELAK